MLHLSSPSHQLKSQVIMIFRTVLNTPRCSHQLPVSSDVFPSIPQEVLGLLFAGFIAEQSQPELFIIPAALLGLVKEGMSFRALKNCLAREAFKLGIGGEKSMSSLSP